MRVEYDFSQACKNPYVTKNEWHLCSSVESRPEVLGVDLLHARSVLDHAAKSAMAVKSIEKSCLIKL